MNLLEAAKDALSALEEFCELQTMRRPSERRDALRAAIEDEERAKIEYMPMTDEELWAAWSPGSYNYDALRAFEQTVVRRMRGEA